MEAVLCTRCTQVAFADFTSASPALCPVCGADLRRAAENERSSGTRPYAGAYASPVAFGGQHNECLAEDWDERFSAHNFLVGMFLTAYGFGMSYLQGDEPQNGGEKVLASYEGWGFLFWMLQLGLVATGVALFISGLGIRSRQPWGYPLAIGCGAVSILAGLLFFAGFSSIGNGGTLEDGVAKVFFIRDNLDFLVGLVDGGGLLYFLYQYHRHSA